MSGYYGESNKIQRQNPDRFMVIDLKEAATRSAFVDYATKSAPTSSVTEPSLTTMEASRNDGNYVLDPLNIGHEADHSSASALLRSPPRGSLPTHPLSFQGYDNASHTSTVTVANSTTPPQSVPDLIGDSFGLYPSLHSNSSAPDNLFGFGASGDYPNSAFHSGQLTSQAPASSSSTQNLALPWGSTNIVPNVISGAYLASPAPKTGITLHAEASRLPQAKGGPAAQYFPSQGLPSSLTFPFRGHAEFSAQSNLNTLPQASVSSNHLRTADASLVFEEHPQGPSAVQNLATELDMDDSDVDHNLALATRLFKSRSLHHSQVHNVTLCTASILWHFDGPLKELAVIIFMLAPKYSSIQQVIQETLMEIDAIHLQSGVSSVANAYADVPLTWRKMIAPQNAAEVDLAKLLELHKHYHFENTRFAKEVLSVHRSLKKLHREIAGLERCAQNFTALFRDSASFQSLLKDLVSQPGQAYCSPRC